MTIRYCKARSKRHGGPCRARAMIGMEVCYHHGGASRRGITHPNYKHGYYSKSPGAQLILSIRFRKYRQAVRAQQREMILDDLANTLPLEQQGDYVRFMAAYRAAVAKLPDVTLTPDLARALMLDT